MTILIEILSYDDTILSSCMNSSRSEVKGWNYQRNGISTESSFSILF